MTRLAGAMLVGLGVGLTAPAVAAERPPLADNEYVNSRILAAAIGDEIRKHCPTISARMLVVVREGRALERHALAAGYSRAEIEAHLRSREQRRRLRVHRDAYLARNGVVEGDPASYCRLGMHEIENRTFVGSLLRAQ